MHANYWPHAHQHGLLSLGRVWDTTDIKCEMQAVILCQQLAGNEGPHPHKPARNFHDPPPNIYNHRQSLANTYLHFFHPSHLIAMNPHSPCEWPMMSFPSQKPLKRTPFLNEECVCARRFRQGFLPSGLKGSPAPWPGPLRQVGRLPHDRATCCFRRPRGAWGEGGGGRIGGAGVGTFL